MGEEDDEKLSFGGHKSRVWERTSWGKYLGFVFLILTFCFEAWGEVWGGSPVLGAGTHYM